MEPTVDGPVPTDGDRPLALVTGVGRTVGIGAGIARELARQGWDLALSFWRPYDSRMPWGVQAADAEAIAEELRGLGASVATIEADLADPAAPERLLAEAGGERPVRALVLSHAESVDSALLDTGLESFDRHFAVNVRASWLLVRAYARQFPAEWHGAGRIVALTSDHTVGNMPYGASTGALDRIVTAAARELAPQGIAANVVNPGPVDTGWMDDDTRAALAARQPWGRLGTPADIAGVVAFLLSGPGGWVNGQLLHADGGFSAP
ncbi:SDR family oxidoreductase [Sinomonas atrocyanea]|uniref:SDR family oxidoreductase n=1 Tax=Sinomonas atrocyanea TaxID=37927 RepID=UPI0027874B05|nr:SDR family oxidoreductase [Sinomonas atrocyanea]MDQ0260771.1 3-oxoacyl-[acyl-carrier protein] reductase [Sinomonas atrocyanea]MDR6622246.1 3-oxoacyl-[acyl-carrier protein] reductase [Sinomonas atrocyanea]